MIDDTVALLNKRKLTDAILSAQTVSDLAEAEHDYYIYATAQNLMGVSYVVAGNEMSAVDCYLRGLSSLPGASDRRTFSFILYQSRKPLSGSK